MDFFFLNRPITVHVHDWLILLYIQGQRACSLAGLCLLLRWWRTCVGTVDIVNIIVFAIFMFILRKAIPERYIVQNQIHECVR